LGMRATVGAVAQKSRDSDVHRRLGGNKRTEGQFEHDELIARRASGGNETARRAFLVWVSCVAEGVKGEDGCIDGRAEVIGADEGNTVTVAVAACGREIEIDEGAIAGVGKVGVVEGSGEGEIRADLDILPG